MSRVLLVEDDAGIREITVLALEAAGHDAIAAANGPAALELTAAQPFDVILLDVRMPLMDGAEFARRYRAAASNPAPIILLTAARDTAVRRDVVEASRYIEKPFDLDELLGAIDEVTRSAT